MRRRVIRAAASLILEKQSLELSMLRNTILAAIFLVTIAVSSGSAQRPAAPATQQPAPVTQGSAAIPESKIALIYSDDFRNPKTGIARYQALMNGLNTEFTKTQQDLNAMAQRIQQLQDEITKASQAAGVIDPKSIQAKSEQLEQLKKDYQRKGEDAQATYKRRHDEVINPLNDDINKALAAYAKAHGITVIIDATQVPMIYVDDKVDITRAFINDFNSKNPAATAATPARP